MREVNGRLAAVIAAVESAARQCPAVQMLVRGDAFKLNACPEAKYPAIAWVQGVHTLTEDWRMLRVSLTLFYIDRLNEQQDNTLQIQSAGVEVLADILQRCEDAGVYNEGQVTYQPFTQRFADECAGVFANVILTCAATSICADEITEGNNLIII